MTIPFDLDGELQRKADFIIQHSTISRNALTIADPNQLRTVSEPADRVRTITETTCISQSNQNVANGINHKADIHVIYGKELEQEPEMLFVNGLAPPGIDKSVSSQGGVESEFTEEIAGTTRERIKQSSRWTSSRRKFGYEETANQNYLRWTFFWKKRTKLNSRWRSDCKELISRWIIIALRIL